MSLGKLLATGRSLVGGAPSLGRYNISERNRLPKFGSAKNPFAPSATSDPKAATPVEVKSEPIPPPPVPEDQVVEERVADLVRVTESVCQPQSPELASAPLEHRKTQRIPELADQLISGARPEGVLEKVAMVVGWLTNVAVIAGRHAAAAALKAWQFVRGIKWGALLRNGRGFAGVA